MSPLNSVFKLIFGTEKNSFQYSKDDKYAHFEYFDGRESSKRLHGHISKQYVGFLFLVYQ